MNSLLIYLAIGLFFTTWMMIQSWAYGEDFVLKDVWIPIFITTCWPPVVLFVIFMKLADIIDSMLKRIDTEKVLIKGRKKNEVRR